jgi:aminoglycoside phosphotransferase family enzyme
MDVASLLALLSKPASYPEPPGELRVYQTHISLVFLTTSHVYKLKKPVRFDFLDFSALEKRRHFCEEEVRLNRRLAPDVYLGVVPVTARGLEGTGEVIDWAVKMRRLPEAATLEQRILQGGVDAPILQALAQRLAQFYATSRSDSGIHAFGRLEVVARNARDNFDQAKRMVGIVVEPRIFQRLQALTEQTLVQCGPLIEERARRGVPCDTHGDLHLDHVYYYPDHPPAHAFVIIDCIEFNQRFRYADPVATRTKTRKLRSFSRFTPPIEPWCVQR